MGLHASCRTAGGAGDRRTAGGSGGPRDRQPSPRRRRALALALASALATAAPAGAAVPGQPPGSAPGLAVEARLGARWLGPLGARDGRAHGVPDPAGVIWWSHSLVRGQVGAGGLTASIDRHGRVLHLFWPGPAHHDQVGGAAGFAVSPDWPDGGIPASVGIRWGIRVGSRFSWLGDPGWRLSFRYASPGSGRLQVAARHEGLGVQVDLEDFVPPELDVLVRRAQVRALRPDLPRVELVFYENLTPRQREVPLATSSTDPVLEPAVERVRRRGADWTHTALDAPVAFALGGEPAADRWVAGLDTGGLGGGVAVRGELAGSGLSAASGPLPVPDAFDAAAAGRYGGPAEVTGPANLALAWDLGRPAPGAVRRVTVLVAAAGDDDAALARLAAARRAGADALAAATDRYWRRWLARAPGLDLRGLPAAEAERIHRVYLRSLVVLGMNLDRPSGALVAGAFRQPPYGQSWVRDNAVTAAILGRMGYAQEARRLLAFTARLQRPDGSFGGASYPSPSPWPFHEALPLTYLGGQADGTGLFAWAAWDHGALTGDRAWLAGMYPAIRRAADWMVLWRDPGTGLHLPSNEEDRILPGQTIATAAAFVAGLEAARAAAVALGARPDPAWAARARELREAIVAHYWVEEPGFFAWQTDPVVGSRAGYPGLGAAYDPGYDPILWDHHTLVWPAGLYLPPDPHAQKLRRHYDHLARRLWVGPPGGTLAGDPIEPYNTGLAWLAVAYVRLAEAGVSPAGRQQAVALLRWIARHAAPGTDILGEVTTLDRPYPQSYASPHSWAHAFFAYAAWLTWPAAGRAPGPRP